VRLGWLADPPKGEGERPDFDAGALFGAAPAPPAADLMPLVVSVFKQHWGSCVAQAVCQAIRMRDRAALGPSSVPTLGSRSFAYLISRAHHHAEDRDDGTNFRSMFTALSKLGLPPEDAWPYDRSPGAFKVPPSTDAFRLAYDARRRIAYHRIYEEGSARLDAVRRAIAAGHPVCFGMNVTEAFGAEHFDATAPLAPMRGAPVGGHALLIVGYDARGFRVLNSWGESWGDHGTFIASPDLIVEQARDLWLVSAGAAA
jgi:hypothetical protein